MDRSYTKIRNRPINYPLGFCQCGCGAKTKIVSVNRPERDQIRGEPFLFLPHHNQRKLPLAKKGMKICTYCLRERPLEEFCRLKRSRDGRCYRCRECNKVQAQAWRAQNPGQAQLHVRRSRFLKEYGIAYEEFERLNTEQNELCAICSQPEKKTNKDGSPQPLSIDHCHNTQTIRGLLCHYCNAGIGHFFDNPQLLIKAAQYLSA